MICFLILFAMGMAGVEFLMGQLSSIYSVVMCILFEANRFKYKEVFSIGYFKCIVKGK